MRAAIYVQYFTSGEGGVYQEQNCIYDFFDFAHPADRVQPFEKLMGLGLTCHGNRHLTRRPEPNGGGLR